METKPREVSVRPLSPQAPRHVAKMTPSRHQTTFRVALLAVHLYIVSALDNGMALTPPMGWMSWQRFKCAVDCQAHPNHCISEDLVKRMVKAMVAGGYLEAGYNFVAIDDCWMEKSRDEKGNIRPDPKRFPNGIKHLSDFVHNHGMKLGIYGAVGPTTCMRYPGNAGHIEADAAQYAEWGVDMLKLDGCFVPLKHLKPAYVSMSERLNQTSRHIAYLCSWPYYMLLGRLKPPWEEIRRRCNMWRVADDVAESLASILNIINTYATLQSVIAPLAGPGSWNDADQLLIGNDGLSEDDCRIQMAMWAILASPLFMSVDLDEIEPWAKNILTNRRLIAINQDPLGRQGIKLAESPPGLGIWVKELTGSRLAIAFLRVQQRQVHEESNVMENIYFSDLKPYFPILPWTQKFHLEEVFEAESIGTFTFRDTFGLERGNNDQATVMLVTLSLIEGEEEEETDGRMREVIANMKRQKENRRSDSKFYKELILFVVVVVFLVLLAFKSRLSICRRLCRFRSSKR